MASLLHGVPVTLYERTQTGKDAFNAPVYTETPTTVENVLVTPTSADAIISDLQLYGKRSVYELCLSKGDAHTWDDCRVDFFGQSFKVFGPVQEYIESMVPLDWNRKVRVERYG